MKRFVLLVILIIMFPINVFALYSIDYIITDVDVIEEVGDLDSEDSIDEEITTTATTTSKMVSNEEEINIEKNDIVENVIDESENLFAYFKEEEGKRLLIEVALVLIDVIILIIIIVKIKNYKLNNKFDDL